jgi:hypothetical protein
MTNRIWEALDDAEIAFFQSGKCPDCGSALLEGPSGGGSQNYSCSNATAVPCGSRFNHMGPFGVERISDARPLLHSAKDPEVKRLTAWDHLDKIED